MEGRISGRMVYFWVLAPYRRNLHSPPFAFYPYPCLVAWICLVRKVAFLSGFPVNCAPVHPLSGYLHTRCAVEACVNAESCSDWLSGTAAELSLSFGSRKQRLMSHRPVLLYLDFPEILTIEFLPGISFADLISVTAV